MHKRLAVLAAMVALVPATLASAQMIGREAFESRCGAKMPAATCTCAANQMQRSETGRIAVEALAAAQLTGSARDDAALAMLNRYNLKASEFESVAQQARQLMDSTIRTCR